MDYIVNTPCGQVKGVKGRVEGSAEYKGIRYANANRFEYPKQVTHWEGVYDASHYGACSYQPRAFYNEEENLKKIFYYNEFRKGETYTYSEDCLFLNIFTPKSAKEGDNLPVLIYIHGGGFTGSCGHEKHFDGPVWTKKGVIGVTLNYRLGPLGFATLPELKEEAGFCGNYGLYDQLCAIKWVKDNISAFGGDPENIAIMGQSAGAMSVQQHCLSPESEGLFNKAIMSSGGGVSKVLSAAPAEKYYDFWRKVMEYSECENLESFRKVSVEKLFSAWEKAKKDLKMPGSFPCIDGRFVVGTGADLLKAKKQHKISYMAGSTSEDMMPPILQSMSKKWCEAQEKDSFVWYFERQLPGDENGAWHSADLWYWFGTLENGWRPWTERDFALSDEMTDCLCNFVKSGNPTDTWLKASKNQKKVMIFGDEKTEMKKTNLFSMIKTMLTNKAVGE